MSQMENKKNCIPELHEKNCWGESSGLRSKDGVEMVKPAKKNTKESKKKQRLVLKNISEPGNNDVLCGRGGSINSHPGNEQYREIVQKYRKVYLNARFKQEKRLIASSIVSEVRALDPPGRFLAKDPRTNIWNDVGDEKARDKTSQALRENAPILRGDVIKEKIKRKPTPKAPISMVPQAAAMNPFMMAQTSRVGVAAVPRTSFPQQPPAQPQWPGSYNPYYTQFGYQRPPGPLRLAQSTPQNSHSTATPLHPPPPLPIAPHLLQKAPPQAAQQNQAARNQNLGMSRSMSWSTSSVTSNQGTEQRQQSNNSKQGKEIIGMTPQAGGELQSPLTPRAVASQLARLRQTGASTDGGAANYNPRSTQLQSKMDVTPNAITDVNMMAGMAQNPGGLGPEPSEGLKRAVGTQEKDYVDKRLRRDYDLKSSRYCQQAGGKPQSVGIQSPSSLPSRGVEAQSPAGHTGGTYAVAQSYPSPTRVAASHGNNNMVVPYSPIKTFPVSNTQRKPQDRNIGTTPSQPPNHSVVTGISDDQKGSFLNTVTQQIFGWDTDAFCGGGIGDLFDSDENPPSPERSQRKEQGFTLLTPRIQKWRGKAGDQEANAEGTDMEYDSTTPSGVALYQKGHRRTPSWEESFQHISPSSFRFQGAPTFEKNQMARWRESSSVTNAYQSSEESKEEAVPLEQGILQQEDRDTMYAVAIQQMENAAASKAHDAAMVANTNRTARSSAHDRLAAAREHGSGGLQQSNTAGNSYVSGTTAYAPPNGFNNFPQVIADKTFAMQLQIVEQAGAGTAQQLEKISRSLREDEEAQEHRNARSAYRLLPKKK